MGKNTVYNAWCFQALRASPQLGWIISPLGWWINGWIFSRGSFKSTCWQQCRYPKTKGLRRINWLIGSQLMDHWSLIIIIEIDNLTSWNLELIIDHWPIMDNSTSWNHHLTPTDQLVDNQPLERIIVKNQPAGYFKGLKLPTCSPWTQPPTVDWSSWGSGSLSQSSTSGGTLHREAAAAVSFVALDSDPKCES